MLHQRPVGKRVRISNNEKTRGRCKQQHNWFFFPQAISKSLILKEGVIKEFWFYLSLHTGYITSSEEKNPFRFHQLGWSLSFTLWRKKNKTKHRELPCVQPRLRPIPRKHHLNWCDNSNLLYIHLLLDRRVSNFTKHRRLQVVHEERDRLRIFRRI